jgi:isopentenyl diphosphate isomerase/L-lactate dehydrogenase-like FMN-dependent dehydrogenase
MLPSIVEEVNKEVDIFLDTGIKRGSDIIKAIALGCKAVLIGRPIIFGLTLEGKYRNKILFRK